MSPNEDLIPLPAFLIDMIMADKECSWLLQEAAMSQQQPFNTRDADRVRALNEKVADGLGDGPSLIKTPEQARKSALIHKIENGG